MGHLANDGSIQRTKEKVIWFNKLLKFHEDGKPQDQLQALKDEEAFLVANDLY